MGLGKEHCGICVCAWGRCVVEEGDAKVVVLKDTREEMDE